MARWTRKRSNKPERISIEVNPDRDPELYDWLMSQPFGAAAKKARAMLIEAVKAEAEGGHEAKPSKPDSPAQPESAGQEAVGRGQPERPSAAPAAPTPQGAGGSGAAVTPTRAEVAERMPPQPEPAPPQPEAPPAEHAPAPSSEPAQPEGGATEDGEIDDETLRLLREQAGRF